MVSSFFEWLWKLFTLLLVLSGCAVISKSESFLSGQDLNLNCSLVSNRVMLDVSLTIHANKAKADVSERNTRTGTYVIWKDLQVVDLVNSFLVSRSTESDLLSISDQHQVNLPNLSYERERTIVMGDLPAVITKDKGRCWQI
tara:strand:+ start:203 stop:628 length:426 start_codon:yes stop_codon:yes gene_type:complete